MQARVAKRYVRLISVVYINNLNQGRSQDFSKGGSHWVIQRVLTRLSPEYCGLSADKKAYKGGVTGTPGPPPGYAYDLNEDFHCPRKKAVLHASVVGVFYTETRTQMLFNFISLINSKVF